MKMNFVNQGIIQLALNKNNMIKEIPMLFSTPMVIAAYNEKKTETRRTRGLEYINEVPDDWKFSNIEVDPREEFGDPDHEEPAMKTLKGLYAVFYDDERAQFVKCPYGKPGDLIWIRETFHKVSPSFKNTYTGQPYAYKADFEPLPNKDIPKEDRFRWKPSIHMPKIAARIWLEIIDIKIERLNDISEESAVSEGVENVIATKEVFGCRAHGKRLFRNYERADNSLKNYPNNGFDSAKVSFETLWESINGIESRILNPWVWVIKFKKIKK